MNLVSNKKLVNGKIPPILLYSEFVQKVRQFKRSSFLTAIRQVCWGVWSLGTKGYKSNPIGGQDFYLIRAHAGKLAVISAFSDEYRSKIVDHKEIVNLCNQYLDIEEPIIYPEKFEEYDFAPLKNELSKSKTFSGFSSNLDLIKQCAAMFTLGRSLSSQHDTYIISNDLNSMYRAWGIFKILKNTYIDQHTYEAFKNRFGIEPKNIYSIGLLLLGKMSRNSGYLNVNQDKLIKDESTNSLTFTNDDCELILERWSRDFNDLRKWHNDEVDCVPDILKKFSPNPLFTTPFVKLSSREYICPSPWHLVKKINNIIIEAISFLDDKEKTDAFIKSGDAINDYLQMSLTYIFKNDSVINLDSLGCLKNISRADFLIISDDATLIIESKRTVFGNESPYYFDSEHTVQSWEKLNDALEQCFNTIKKIPEIEKEIGKSIPKKISCVICVNETLISGAGIFYNFAYHSGYLKNKPTNNFEIMGIDELETLLIDKGPKKIAEEISKKWDGVSNSQINPDEHLYHLIYKNNDEPKPNYSDWKFLEEYENDILPHRNSK